MSYLTLSSMEEGAVSVLVTIVSLAPNVVPGTQYIRAPQNCIYVYTVDP